MSMVSVWSDFQFALSEAKYWQRNVNTDLLLYFVVAATCFDYNNFSYLAKVKIVLNISNKREIKIYFS